LHRSPFGLAVVFLLFASAWPATARDAAPQANDPWLGRDKASHLALSLSVVGFGYHLARFEGGGGRGQARAASFGAAVGLGLAKELRDRECPGNRFSFRDLLFDLAGAGLGLLIFTTNK